MKFKLFRESLITEDLKIVKKKWNIKIPNYEVEVNDKKESHDMLKRIKDRTLMTPKQIQGIIESGLKYIVKKKSFFKNDKNFVELTFNKSKFKILILFKPENKYLRVSSIMSLDMDVTNALHWDINEFHEEFKYDITGNIFIAETCDWCTVNLNEDDDYFCIETNEITNSKDVYIADPTDVIKMDANY